VARKLLWGSLALAPITILVDKLTGAGDVTLFVLAAAALVALFAVGGNLPDVVRGALSGSVI